jgi:hypothetical protein
VKGEVKYLCDAPELEALVGTPQQGSLAKVTGTTNSALTQDSSRIRAWRIQSGVSQPNNGTEGSCTFAERRTKVQNGTEKSSATYLGASGDVRALKLVDGPD